MGSSKERLKWTQELHDLFEKSVNQLGGPERVTPKSVLKVMGIPGLTIYHVKSHLQKYRMSKFVPESSSKGKFERRSISEILPNFSTTSGAQLQEALILQMKVQMRLSDQLEVQRNLKVKIEAQGRFLERIAEENKNRPSICNPNKLLSPISLPPLREETDPIKSKEFEPDLFSNKSEISYKEELQAPKRLKVDDDVFVQRFKTESYNQGAKFAFPSEENNFPWSFGFCQSPLIPAAYDTYG